MASITAFKPKRLYGTAAARPAATVPQLGTIYTASDGGQRSIVLLNAGDRAWANITALTSLMPPVVRFDTAANAPIAANPGIGKRVIFCATDTGAVTRYT